MAMLEKKGYLRRIKTATKSMSKHPRKHGIKMQAHHIISAIGVELALKSDDLRQLGYDINDLNNLVFIPCTLQGACHLRTQLHRGDHKKDDPFGMPDPDAADSDNDHPPFYHLKIKKKVKNLFIEHNLCKSNTKQVQDIMNELSGLLLKKINDFSLHLTAISTNFKSGNEGCMGVDNVPSEKDKNYQSLRATKCPVGRDHQLRTDHQHTHGPHQKNEKITYKKGKYTLEAGK